MKLYVNKRPGCLVCLFWPPHVRSHIEICLPPPDPRLEHHTWGNW